MFEDDNKLDWNKLVYYHCGHFSGTRAIERHHHPGCEIIYVKTGKCINVFEEVRLPAESGQLVIVPPEITHSQENLEHTETLFVTFSAGIDFFETKPVCVDIDHDCWIAKWLDDICSVNEKLLGHHDEMTKGLLFSLLTRLLVISRNQDRMDELHPAVAKAITFIERHFAEPISIESIAEECGVSLGYFSSLFRETMGIGPLKYLNRLRMKLAVQLLRNSYLAIGDVAERCGYPDPNYFTRTFKQHLNCTPSEFRRIEREMVPSGQFSEKFHYIYDDKKIPQK